MKQELHVTWPSENCLCSSNAHSFQTEGNKHKKANVQIIV